MALRIDGSGPAASQAAGRRSPAKSAITARLGQRGTIEASAVPMLGDLLTRLDGLAGGGQLVDVPAPSGSSMSPARRFSELQSLRRPLRDAVSGAAGAQRRALARCESVLERYLEMKESALMRAEFHG